MFKGCFEKARVGKELMVGKKITDRQKRESKRTRSGIPSTAPLKSTLGNVTLVHSQFQMFKAERERKCKLARQKLNSGGLLH